MTTGLESWPARVLHGLAYRYDAFALGRRRARYRAHASGVRQDWDWEATPYNRIALVNHLLARIPDPAYLEIGCDRNTLFDAVPVSDKTGVDPVRGGTVRTTSDAFFQDNDRVFDFCFVDGLHSYEQTRRDVANAIAALAPGGWVLIHDMLPRCWEEEHMPRIQDEWTGDVWKVAVDLAATPDIDFAVVAIDHGVGVVRPRRPGARLADHQASLRDARYGDFCAMSASLPTLNWGEALAWIERIDPR